jgi:hypothetical protein
MGIEPRARIEGRLVANETMKKKLIEQLRKNSDQFRFYAKSHKTKAEGFRHSANGRFMSKPVQRENLLEQAQASDDKAAVNEALAGENDALLAEYS